MPRLKLTKSAIDKIPLVERGAVVYFDTDMPGFGLRIGKTKKTFIAQRDIMKKTHISTIGTYGVWTPDQARQEARERLLLLSKGIDPDEAKRQHKAKAITLRALMEEFFIARKTLKPITQNAYRGYLACHLSDWLDRPVIDITEEKFSTRYTFIGENRGRTVANCVRRTLSAMLNYGIACHKLSGRNVTRIIAETKSAYPDNRRRTYIKPHQLKIWYEAVNNLPNPTYRDYLLLVLFTGLRRNEAASLRWSRVDFLTRTFSVIETKNGDPLTLPMSDFVYALFQERKQLTGESDFVFPGSGRKGHLAEPKKGVAAVCQEAGVSFTVHDLRRTFITVAESLDISTYSLKALLNHRFSEITASYIIMDVERLRKPMQAIAKYIQEQIYGEKSC